jgi:hypothetical protein
MPDLTLNITITAEESALLSRLATSLGKTRKQVAEDMAHDQIRRQSNSDVRHLLDKLRQKQMTAVEKTQLKAYIDNL